MSFFSQLTRHDYQLLLYCIDMFYSVPARDQLLRYFCTFVENYYSVSHAVFFRHDLQKQELLISDHFLFNIAFDDFFKFKEYYHLVHPLYALLNAENQFEPDMNKVYSLNDFVDDKSLMETEYRNDWQRYLPAFYEIGALLSYNGHILGDIALLRPRKAGRFTELEKEFFDYLLPHLSRALYLLDIKSGKMGIAKECGVIEYDVNGKVSAMNLEAKKIIADKGEQWLQILMEDSQITTFTRGAYDYTVQRIPLDWGRIRGIVLLHPFAKLKKLQHLLQPYELSKRQEDIAVLVLRGFDNKTIAEKLSLTEQTVKDHLKEIFAKMKIRKRSEMSAVLFELNLTL